MKQNGGKAGAIAGRCPRCPLPAEDPTRCRGEDVRRFCELIDPSCPAYDPGYVGVILAESRRLASEPVRPTPAESAALVRAMRACPYRSAGSTGCGCGHCGLRAGAAVSHLECFACIKQHGAA